jgi:hypothetical protein
MNGLCGQMAITMQVSVPAITLYLNIQLSSNQCGQVYSLQQYAIHVTATYRMSVGFFSGALISVSDLVVVV